MLTILNQKIRFVTNLHKSKHWNDKKNIEGYWKFTPSNMRLSRIINLSPIYISQVLLLIFSDKFQSRKIICMDFFVSNIVMTNKILIKDNNQRQFSSYQLVQRARYGDTLQTDMMHSLQTCFHNLYGHKLMLLKHPQSCNHDSLESCLSILGRP